MASKDTDQSPQEAALVAVLVTSDRREAIRSEEAETASTLEGLRDFPCDTPDDEADLAEILGAIKAKAKELEAMRTSITGPLNAAKRAVDALFKPAAEAMAEAERIIKAKLAHAAERREAANRAALERAQQAARAGDSASASAALAEVSTGKPAGVSFRHTWDFTLDDLDKVPRKWLTLDRSAVHIYLRGYDGKPVDPPPVPGLTFKKSTNVTARAATKTED